MVVDCNNRNPGLSVGRQMHLTDPNWRDIPQIGEDILNMEAEYTADIHNQVEELRVVDIHNLFVA